MAGGLFLLRRLPAPPGHPDLWLFRYDPRTDTWTELAIPPGPFGFGGPGTMGMGGTMGGKLYVGNGQSNILLVYDPATNTWTEKATPRALRLGAAFATLGARLYMIGGVRINTDGTYSEVRATNAYDPATNTWANLAPLPTPRSWTAANRVMLNGEPRIELVGGARPGNNLQYTP